MNINPKELQKFHDLWAPMISALPAVINAAETATELQNHVIQLRKQCDDALAEADKARGNAEISLSRARAELKEIAQQKAEQAKLLKEHAQACKEKINQAEAHTAAVIDSIQSKAAEAERAIAALAQDLADRKAKADAEYAEHLAVKKAEADELEKRIEAAEKQLEKLRAKLG